MFTFYLGTFKYLLLKYKMWGLLATPPQVLVLVCRVLKILTRGCRAGRVIQSTYRFSKFAFVREFTLAAALSHSVRQGAVAAPSAVFSPKTVEALATTACRLKASLVSFQNKAVGVLLTIWKLSENSCTTSICYRTFNTGNSTLALASPVRAEHVLVSRDRRTAESCLLVKLYLTV